MAEPLSLGQLGRVLFRHWALIVALSVVGGVAGYGLTQLMTPVYTATATQLIKGLPGTGVAANYEAAQYAVSRAKSYPSFVYSATVLQGVKTDLGGPATTADLAEDLVVVNPVDTPLLEISATASTPGEARDKANSAARHMARFITQVETVNGKAPISVETPVQAVLPTEKTSPQTLLIAALGVLVGFVLAVVAGLINTFVPRRVRAVVPREVRWDSVQVQPGPDAEQPGRDANAPLPDAVDEPSLAAEPAPVSAQDDSRASQHSESVIKGHGTDTLVNGHADPIVNGHAGRVVDGHVEPIVNGHAEPVLNGHAEPVVNGHAELVLNGHAEPVSEGVDESSIPIDGDPTIKASGDWREMLIHQSNPRHEPANGTNRSSHAPVKVTRNGSSRLKRSRGSTRPATPDPEVADEGEVVPEQVPQ